jgi:hypothetical protein
MATVAISAKPDTKVTGLSIKRTNNDFKATWKVPSSATKDSNNKRWEKIHIHFYATVDKLVSGKRKEIKAYAKTYDWGTSSTSCTFTLTTAILNALYPKSDPNGHFLKSVTCEIYAKNNKGKGPTASATFKLASPAVPTVEIEFDAATNKVTATAKASNEANLPKQRTDTILTLKRSGTVESGGAKVLLDKSPSTSTNRSWSYLIPNADALTTGQFEKLTASAQSRGWRGRSGAASATYYIAHPNVPVCDEKNIAIVFATDGVYSTASVFVPVLDAGKLLDGSTKIWPETLKLQRLKDSHASTPVEASTAQGWADVSGAVGTGECTGFMDTWADGKSTDADTRTWYRIVAEKDGYIQYGVPADATCIKGPDSSGATGAPTIGTIANGRDGESIIVPVSWTDASVDGVELTWSVHEDAWQSNESLSPLDVDWGSNQSATATIYGLKTGEPVYVRAKSYTLDSDGNKTYSGLSDAVMAIPYDSPDNVTVSAPGAVVAGDEIPVEWTFGSDSPQQWADVMVDGVAMSATDSSGGHTVDGADGAAAIPTEGMTLGSHTISVLVSTDGVTGVASPTTTVLVAEAPTGTVSVTGTQDSSSSSPTYGSLVVTAQPLEVILTTSTKSPSAIIAVVADGAAADEMHEAQPEGEVVWSAAFSGSQLKPPSTSTSYARTTDTTVNPTKTYYTKSGNVYTKVDNPTQQGLSSYYEYTGTAWAMSASEAIDIRDWCGYSVRCSLTDEATGLSADLAPALFSVKWAHQAVAPDGTVTVNETARSATITVPAPTGASQTDVLDLYRVTPGGKYLIASGRAFGSSIIDTYAPFKSRHSDAELRYRAVLRTADGDMEFSDIGYELTCGSLRLDWDENSVELPYDISRGDSFSKDFGDRVHADGSRGGFWSPAIEHKGSLSTNLIKIRSVEQREALMDMARYAGPVFVRTPEGMAYCSNANLGSMEVEVNNMAISVSIDASEIGLTDSFMAEPVVEA